MSDHDARDDHAAAGIDEDRTEGSAKQMGASSRKARANCSVIPR